MIVGRVELGLEYNVIEIVDIHDRSDGSAGGP